MSDSYSGLQLASWRLPYSEPEILANRRDQIVKRLPASLKAAVDLLKEDNDAKRWMGGEMYGQFLKVKEIEVKNWSQIPEEDRRKKFIMYF